MPYMTKSRVRLQNMNRYMIKALAIRLGYECIDKGYVHNGSFGSVFDLSQILVHCDFLKVSYRPEAGVQIFTLTLNILIGVDLKKDKQILNDAYIDNTGVTVDFNLNLLARINSELDANFELEHIDHCDFYNADVVPIEMHLVSQRLQEIKVGKHLISFESGETIHTESSYKYTIK